MAWTGLPGEGALLPPTENRGGPEHITGRLSAATTRQPDLKLTLKINFRRPSSCIKAFKMVVGA